MPSILIEIRAEMEDGTVHDVVADQRDVAKWEVQDFGCSFAEIDTRPMMALRWLAWCALSRRGETKLAWPEFDAQCIEAGDPGDPEESGLPADGVDPGQPATSDTDSSSSR